MTDRDGDLSDGTGASIEDLVKIVLIDNTAKQISVGDQVFDTQQSSNTVPELATWLYVHLHAGNPRAFGLDALRPDPQFESEVLLHVPDCKSRFPARLVSRSDGVSFLDVNRVCVGIPSSLEIADDAIELNCLRPNLSPGFLMFIHEAVPLTLDRVSRFYIHHDDASSALDDWSNLVQHLVRADLSFRSKILSRRASFPRHDSIVVYVSETVKEAAALLAETGSETSARLPKKSLLTRWSSHGVSTAEEPRDLRVKPGWQSFGQHRTLAIARAVHDTLAEDVDLLQSLARHFVSANIALDDASRNEQ